MKREILFRGKRLGEWFYGHIYHDQVFQDGSPCCDVWFIRDDCDEDHEVDEKTIGQYIGKDDKDGVKIFEGDEFEIIFSNCPNGFSILGKETKYIERKGEVVMHFGEWRIKVANELNEIKYSSLQDLLKRNPKAIIGNIHDNIHTTT